MGNTRQARARVGKAIDELHSRMKTVCPGPSASKHSLSHSPIAKHTIVTNRHWPMDVGNIIAAYTEPIDAGILTDAIFGAGPWGLKIELVCCDMRRDVILQYNSKDFFVSTPYGIGVWTSDRGDIRALLPNTPIEHTWARSMEIWSDVYQAHIWDLYEARITHLIREERARLGW
jgi:hypothetical protein